MSERLMDGFPPRPDTQVTLANWRTAPFNQWAFHHVRELLPTADIPHDATNVRELPVVARRVPAGSILPPCDRQSSVPKWPDNPR